MNTKQTGDIAEQMILASLLERGYTVLNPIGDRERYDIVVDHGAGVFERVQCKSALLKDGVITFGYKSSYRGKDGKTVYRKYTPEEIDTFMLYEPSMKRVYVIDINNMVYKLRITPPVRNANRCHYAGDFLFHDFKNSEVVNGQGVNFVTRPMWAERKEGMGDFTVE